ncbi:MAG TPA: hypothetical protein VGD07_11275 [Methylomirabilota bacterium]
MFRRGEDDLPRGSVTLMFKCILHDEREALYRAIVRKRVAAPQVAVGGVGS